MGHGIIVECNHCRENGEAPYIVECFQLGIGMMYSSLENVIDLLHYTRRPKVLDILNNHAVADTDYSHELYHCPRCHRLYERFHVKIIYIVDDEEKVYETSYACPKCKTPMQIITEDDLPQIPCSSCGEKALQVIETMCWD